LAGAAAAVYDDCVAADRATDKYVDRLESAIGIPGTNWVGRSQFAGAAIAIHASTLAQLKEVRSMPKKPRVASGTTRTVRARRMPLPDHHEIAARAYQLFVQRGGEHGRDMEDWLVAERELRQPDTTPPGIAG